MFVDALFYCGIIVLFDLLNKSIDSPLHSDAKCMCKMCIFGSCQENSNKNGFPI